MDNDFGRVTSDSADYNHTFYGILNAQGKFWTPLPFHDEKAALAHLCRYAVGSNSSMLDTHRIVPVRVVLTVCDSGIARTSAAPHRSRGPSMTEQLSPEQEALVEEVAKQLCLAAGDDPSREGDWSEWWHLSSYAREARAIIPLIYTAGRRAGREEAAKVCEQQSDVFLSPQYAVGQPLSSFGERLACAACAREIRNLDKQEEGRGL